MLRVVLGVVIGCLIGLIVTGMVDGLGNMVVPPPPGVNLTDPQALRTALPLLATQAKVAMVLAAFLGVLAGASVANMVAGRRRLAGFIAGGLLVALHVFNMVTLAFPTWMIAAEAVAFVVAVAAADRAFGRRRA
jgi:hypothetical protein